MLITKVGEPRLPSTGDVWFDPTTMLTHVYHGGFGTPWTLLPPSQILPSNPNKGYIDVDWLTHIPSMWDGNSWISAVPAGYQLPPNNPTVGSTWVDSLTGRIYLYYANQWVPLAAQNGSPSPPSLPPPSKPVGSWQTSQSQFAQLTSSPVNDITIAGPNGMLVKIDTGTGNITYGQGYTPDAAAQIFWNAIAGTSPRFLQTQINDLVKDLKDVTTRLAVAEGQVLKFKEAGYKMPEPAKSFDPMDAWNRAMGIIK